MRAVVTGAGGFIGHHLVKRLQSEGYWVGGVDVKAPQFEDSAADEFLNADLRRSENCVRAVDATATTRGYASCLAGSREHRFRTESRPPTHGLRAS